jgi:hypothetical protein
MHPKYYIAHIIHTQMRELEVGHGEGLDSFLGNADSNDGNPSETTQEKWQSKDAFKRRSKQA